MPTNVSIKTSKTRFKVRTFQILSTHFKEIELLLNTSSLNRTQIQALSKKFLNIVAQTSQINQINH